MDYKHLNSFTILEALISLTLMGIIIALTYSIFNLIEKQMTLFQKENTSFLQYNLFNTAIKNDMAESNDFVCVNNLVSLKYYADKDINYSLYKDYILRRTAIKTDTFKLHTLKHKLLSDDLKPLNKVLCIYFEMLGDSIKTNYYLKKKHN